MGIFSSIFGGEKTRKLPFQSTSTNGPSAFSQPYITGALDRLNTSFAQPRQHYTQAGMSAVPGMSDYTRQGQDMIAARAGAGNPLMSGAQNYVTDTISGGNGNKYLGGLQSFAGGGSNPWLDRSFDSAASRVQDRVNGQFNASGRFRSGAHQDVTTRGLNDLASNIYGSAYETDANRRLNASQSLAQLGESDLSRRLSAAFAAPGMNEAEYADANRLVAMGQGNEERYTAPRLAEAIQGFDFARDDGLDRSIDYAKLMGGLLGNYNTETRSGFNTQIGQTKGILSGVKDIASLIKSAQGKGGLK